MSYERFLASIAGPRTVCVDLYSPLMLSYSRLAMMKDYHVNFEELFEELISFVMEDYIADAGMEYYVSYLSETMEQLGSRNSKHDMDIYLPVVEYLGKVLRHVFRSHDMYVDGVANYRLAKWLTPTTIVFEKYMAYDMSPSQPPGTGLLVKVETLVEVAARNYAAVIEQDLLSTLRRGILNKHF